MNLDKHRPGGHIRQLEYISRRSQRQTECAMTTCAEQFRIKGRPNKVQSDTHSGQGSLGKLSPP